MRGWVVVAVAVLWQAALALGGDLGCTVYAPPVETGAVPALLPELSGLAASQRYPGIYWAINDSGNAFVLYAMRESGSIVAAFPVRGEAQDPEDVALGPCGPGSSDWCVYVADTGDNMYSHPHGQLFRVREPNPWHGRPLGAERLPFRYPDGSHDAEAILIDPHTADVFVVTKSLFSLGDVYRVGDLAPGRMGRAERVLGLALPEGFDALTTAASAHASGTRILLRTYRSVWEFIAPNARSLPDVLRAQPREVPAPRQRQGEAISFTADGHGYFLGGEGVGNRLARVDCKAP